jgi:hypothetical protein
MNTENSQNMSMHSMREAGGYEYESRNSGEKNKKREEIEEG